MSDASDPAAPVERDDPRTVGAELRAAREGAGQSLDDVAQQLKLAPRQVRALEEDDYPKLPGRTFVRGFVRNYARVFGLDADDLVARLPGTEPSLERPTITPSGRPMGALPAATAPRNWARWAIPLLLVAIVCAAGVYELRRPQQNDARRVSVADKPVVAPGVPATSVVTAGGTTSSTLPNPLAADAPADAAVATGSATPATGSAPPGAASSTSAEPTAASPASAATPPGAAGEPLLVLTFKASAWVQVKDRNGTVLLAQNGQAGTTQAIAGPLPLDVVVGNANDVSATFRGQAVDLAPFVRGNVARLSLK